MSAAKNAAESWHVAGMERMLSAHLHPHGAWTRPVGTAPPELVRRKGILGTMAANALAGRSRAVLRAQAKSPEAEINHSIESDGEFLNPRA